MRGAMKTRLSDRLIPQFGFAILKKKSIETRNFLAYLDFFFWAAASVSESRPPGSVPEVNARRLTFCSATRDPEERVCYLKASVYVWR